MNPFFRTNSIRTKLIFLGILLTVLSTSIVGLTIVNRSNHIITEQTKTLAMAFAEDLAAECIQPLLSDNLSKLKDSLNSLRAIPHFGREHIRNVMIIDNNGNVIAQNNVEEPDKGHLNDVIKETASVKDPRVLLVDRHKYEVITPIEKAGKRLGVVLLDYTVGHLTESMSILWTIFLVILILLIGVGVAGCFGFSNTMVEPIQKLANAAVRISKGDLAHRIKVESRDELGQLANCFNKMADNLQKITVSKDYVGNIIRSITDGLIVIDAEGKIETVNQATLDLLGYQEDELREKPVQMLFAEDTLFKGLRLEKLIKEDAVKNYETMYRTKAGQTIPVILSASVMKDKEEKILGIVLIAKDITERKRMEETLQKSEALLRNTFEAIPDLLTVHNRDLRIVLSNWHGHEFVPMEHRDKQPHCYWAYMHRDVPCEPCHTLEVFETGKPKTVEFFNPDPRVGFLEISAYPVFDDSGKVIMVTEHVRNINERKQAEEEKRRLEAQLRQARKMEAIGTLAGGIAHDFNNLLMGIQGNVSLMLLNIDTRHPHYERLRRIEEQIQSGAKLTTQLLGYARKGKYEVKPINLNQLVEETAETFGRTKKEITIHRALARYLSAIEADQGQIEQVLLNLFVNAADAMPGGGNLILETRNVTHEDMKGKLYHPKPGHYVWLKVTDTGVGMDQETQERIFDPFFTTKEIGRGTGLGLASVYGIIKSHGGYIDVESEKGHGTTFNIYLPVTRKKIQKVVKIAEQVLKGTETILLVDDEKVIRELGRELLKAMGYRVLTAKDGKEAVEMYGNHGDDIDLVLLDMVMPNMGGSEAFDQMRRIDPKVKVLLSSGYSLDGQAMEILERGCDGFIQKPFKMSELSRKIREILRNPKDGFLG